MKDRAYIAIDNGVTGTIGMVADSLEFDGTFTHWDLYEKVPSYKARSYTAKKQMVTHLDYEKLKEVLDPQYIPNDNWVIVTERPLVNPRMFKASMSAVRAHEILLAVLRSLRVELYATWDSKLWQKAMLGDVPKGKSKELSAAKGIELYPRHKQFIEKHGDADALLMAHYLRECVLAEENSATKET